MSEQPDREVHPKLRKWMERQEEQALVSHGFKLVLSAQARREVIKNLRQISGPTAPYFILIVLSTLIAGFGLVANSTATVIGAMIVAPLMGPILGLALAFVRGNTRMFRSSLFAELTGVLLVIATGILVAVLVGPAHIDFSASEIAGRTNPTLYDLLIGLAAGLAGAYCTANPRLSGSVAGVAIAVALVPPLAVTGLCTAGALAGVTLWSAAFGSFMLFLANFLTIEMAAMGVFIWAGLGEANSLLFNKEMRKALVANLVLLLFTSVFLGFQLTKLLELRQIRGESLKLLHQELARIPGASLSQLKVDRHENLVRLEATIASRNELTPEIVAELEKSVRLRVERPVEMVVQAVASTYITSTGFLYEPPDEPPDPQQVLMAKVQSALKRALSSFPGSDLDTFRQLSGPGGRTESGAMRLQVSIKSPYVFEPELVARLQKLVEENLDGRKVDLMVRTVVTSSADASGYVRHAAPETRSPEELARLQTSERRQQAARKFLESQVARLEGYAWTRPLELEEYLDPSQRVILRVRACLQGPSPIEVMTLAVWERALEKELAREALEADVVMAVQHTSGISLTYEGNDVERARALLQDDLEGKLQALVGTFAGAQLGETSFTFGSAIEVKAVLYSPKVLTPKQVAGWQNSLTRVARAPVRLTVDNRLGAVVTAGSSSQESAARW